jgi:adenine-specific DNA-methyltransferase
MLIGVSSYPKGSAMSEAYKKLIKTLQTLFEMDKADLDFGIYRIMNQKRDEINQFLENDLLPQVKEAFADYADGSQTELKKELQAAIDKAREFGAPDPENVPAVLEIKEKMALSVDITAVENEVYSHLHTFFSRYYDKGDFISQRRYKKDTYAIPYEGEEVKLYWANHDQYYVKSSEHLRDYAFIVRDDDGKTVRIKLVEADTEKDNVKAESGKERRFVLDADNPLSVENGELHIHFHYRPAGKKKQEALNKEAVEIIFKQEGVDDWLALLRQKAPTEKNPDRTLLEKHLNDYTARNTFDYFIHKDLGGFLRRELDFYIKNEVLHLDDIDDAAFEVTEQLLRKIKVIRAIAHKIIRMLAQLEDFQKKLWLKKKFVVETNYCITLDRISETLRDRVLSCDAQWDDWIQLGVINAEDAKTDEKRRELLLTSPFLVIDTKHYLLGFREELVARFHDLDSRLDGILAHGDCFQVVNLIKPTYSARIKSVYIDPPYNTGDDNFIYEDNFRHSSWLSFLQCRLGLIKDLLSEQGAFMSSIDDNESHHLRKLLDTIFSPSNIPPFYFQVRYEGKTLTEDLDFQKLIENVLICGMPGFLPIKPTKQYTLDKFCWNITEKSSGKEIILGGKKCIIFHEGEYDITKIQPNIDGLKEIWATGSVLDKNSSGRFFRDFISSRIVLDGYKVLYKVYGIGDDGLGYRYFTGPKRVGATKGKFYPYRYRLFSLTTFCASTARTKSLHR